jgi:hypothetical protein
MKMQPDNTIEEDPAIIPGVAGAQARESVSESATLVIKQHTAGRWVPWWAW